MSRSTKCAHPVCKCEIPKERFDQNALHCSDGCAVETSNADRCSCGHAPCDLELVEGAKESESVIGLGPENRG
jgi:hypothetical protein